MVNQSSKKINKKAQKTLPNSEQSALSQISQKLFAEINLNLKPKIC